LMESGRVRRKGLYGYVLDGNILQIILRNSDLEKAADALVAATSGV
jgi:hypothetical protein